MDFSPLPRFSRPSSGCYAPGLLSWRHVIERAQSRRTCQSDPPTRKNENENEGKERSMERESINRQQKPPPVPELPYSKYQIPNGPPTNPEQIIRKTAKKAQTGLLMIYPNRKFQMRACSTSRGNRMLSDKGNGFALRRKQKRPARPSRRGIEAERSDDPGRAGASMRERIIPSLVRSSSCS